MIDAACVAARQRDQITPSRRIRAIPDSDPDIATRSS
jgi:hypothetical protein